MTDTATVVLVHGLWMPGASMSLLRRRIEQCGFSCRHFNYPTLHRDVRYNAERLHKFVEALGTQQVHFVCHSLGGLVIQRMLADRPLQTSGRIVALGTPFRGSGVARQLARITPGRWSLGASRKVLTEGIDESFNNWELGVIAGTLRFGFGTFITRLEGDHDGTVAVDETRLDGTVDHLTLKVSHTGLLFSAEVAQQTCYFLKNGCFSKQ